MIKAIETHYGGCIFRSRTEARWAVMFDALGLDWEYEKEGFELPSGWYLPDFWVPEWRAWVEVKGEAPTDREQRLTYELSEATGKRTIIAIGTPKEGAEQFESMFCMKMKIAEDDKGLCLAYDLGSFDSTQPLPYRKISIEKMEKTKMTPRLSAAIKKARSARFEHGARN